ncbi:twin-arginine translocation pathway signal protein [Pseudoruegeria sp. HB172150]|uniref:Acg family FMN-binding oxidoreductase n=1 Tax=Pseudoruegeria sp. HB172150 TaxID=2721164 RepID=UPI0015567248|nr:twin-arginine translocation pathway signal protein [Pseudoruegeria sp. HB172150]
MTRRKSIALIGGGIVLAATAAAGVRVMRKPQTATDPWETAGTGDDPRLTALSYAILAPSAHNLQPWLAKLEDDGSLTILQNQDLRLPQVDPLGRQHFIGMGCFIELLSMAFAEQGLNSEIQLFPDAETSPDNPVATVTLTDGATADPLFAHVLDRRTNRAAYDMALEVPPDAILGIEGSAEGAQTVHEPELLDLLRELTLEAMLTEANTEAPALETIENMRIGARQIDASPDGIALRGPAIEAMAASGLLSQESLSKLSGTAHEASLKTYRDAFPATPAYLWFATGQNERADQIAAGRAWVRMHLAATAYGLSVQPVSQSLEEYEEMTPYRERVHELLAPGGARIQMLGRLGFGPETPPSPRWPVEAKLI